MPARQHVLPSEPPSLSPEQAIQLVKRQLDRLEEVEKLRYDDPKVASWESTTRDILDKAFGKPQGVSNRKTNEVHASSGEMWINMPDAAIQQGHLTKSQYRKALLEAFIEQLQDGLAPQVMAVPGYGFHREIERVSFSLLKDGHYKQAALEAYIRVIDEVKVRSGLPLEGDTLMNQAFGCDGGENPALAHVLPRTPNAMNSAASCISSRASWAYVMRKADSNTLFNDPSRAHEYLVASLLMRLLEISKKTP